MGLRKVWFNWVCLCFHLTDWRIWSNLRELVGLVYLCLLTAWLSLRLQPLEDIKCFLQWFTIFLVFVESWDYRFKRIRFKYLRRLRRQVWQPRWWRNNQKSSFTFVGSLMNLLLLCTLLVSFGIHHFLCDLFHLYLTHRAVVIDVGLLIFWDGIYPLMHVDCTDSLNWGYGLIFLGCSLALSEASGYASIYGSVFRISSALLWDPWSVVSTFG